MRKMTINFEDNMENNTSKAYLNNPVDNIGMVIKSNRINAPFQFTINARFLQSGNRYFRNTMTKDSKGVHLSNKNIHKYRLTDSEDEDSDSVNLYQDSPADYSQHALNMLKGFFVSYDYKRNWGADTKTARLMRKKQALEKKLIGIKDQISEENGDLPF